METREVELQQLGVDRIENLRRALDLRVGQPGAGQSHDERLTPARPFDHELGRGRVAVDSAGHRRAAAGRSGRCAPEILVRIGSDFCGRDRLQDEEDRCDRAWNEARHSYHVMCCPSGFATRAPGSTARISRAF